MRAVLDRMGGKSGKLVVLGGLLAVGALVACQAEERRNASPPPPAAGSGKASEDSPLVVFLGDSLTAGYGLGKEQAYPAVVARRLSQERRVRVVNAGVSGDTSAGGLRRLSWILRQEPDVVVVELGANDGLRGVPLQATEENLRQIILGIQESGARVLLLGMRLPPNYGPDYTEGFAALYRRLAEELEVAAVPFLLEGVGGNPELNLPDGIHPNAEGHEKAAENVLPYLKRLLEEGE